MATPPVISGVPTRIVVREDNVFSETEPNEYFDLSGISITDEDLVGDIAVTVSATIGRFNLANSSSVTFSWETASTVTVTGTLLNVLNYLKIPSNWVYEPPANLAGEDAAEITITDRDVGNPGEGSTSHTIFVDITPENDAPVVSVPAPVDVATEKATEIKGIVFSDVDAGDSNITATISAPAGTLAATSGAGVTVGGTSSALTLTGTLANVNAFIAAGNLTYTAPTSGTVQLTASINDGGNTGTGGPLTDTKTFDVVAAYSAPDITAANVLITGATGTGGTFKVGDTVTVSWNNSSTGDDNPAISGVTVDFSEFGATASVAATAVNGVWTATYTIVAGGIDTTDASVELTATNPDASATGSSDDVSIDNVAPAVTDPSISLSGATGDDDVFIAGDIVTATWDNTAAGDNNTDTIASVTFDFSAFGGGTAVAATNVAGKWVANYTLPDGQVATNLNVTATVTDNAGNATTVGDTSDASVDTEAPEVVGVNVPAAHTYTLGQSLWFTVRFDQIVEVDSTDGTPRLVIDLNTGGPAYAEFSSGSGSDELRFELIVASGMVDPDGITIGALQLNGGTITDAPGNSALLTLNNVPLTDGVRVDSPAPGGGTGTPPPGPITIWGTEFDDRLNQLSRDATYMGLEGRDTVVYDGARADFSIAILPSGTIRLSNDQFTHIHNSIERIEFSDGVLVFDINGDFAASIYRLYGGAFGRAPDEDGLRFWAGMEDEGLTLVSVAVIFLGSPEFADRFGSDISNAALVDMLYENILGRDGDADGVAFWSAYLDNGGDRAKALLMFTTLPEYVGISESDITPGFWIT